jgi:hypothetical protein
MEIPGLAVGLVGFIGLLSVGKDAIKQNTVLGP